MSDQPEKRRSSKIVTIATVLILLSVYVTPYFLYLERWVITGSSPAGPMSPVNSRYCSSSLVLKIYIPLAWMEAKVTRNVVVLLNDSEEEIVFIARP